jgi:hypothetical protein
MRIKRIAGIVAAAALAMSFGGSALAVDPSTDSVDVSVEITAQTAFSVEVVKAVDFPAREFTLGPALNYTAQSSYWLEVTDMRGTGAGWNVTAHASAFTPSVPGSGLITTNNGPYTGCFLPGFTDQGPFCSGPLAVPTGVGVVAGSPDIIATTSSIFASTAGLTAAPSPYGSGSFETQETLYYVGFPNALAVGAYESTVTFTLSGLVP